MLNESSAPSEVEGLPKPEYSGFYVYGIVKTMHYVYMLKNPSNELYIGVTKEAEKRLYAHNTGHGALFTKGSGKFHIVFLEEYETLAQARAREIQIKKWRREKKENLIQQFVNGQPTKLKLIPQETK